MADCATLATRLTQAETALHALETGRQVVSLRLGEKQQQYTPASVDKLRAYIASLKTQVDACNGVRTNRRRIMRVLPIG